MLAYSWFHLTCFFGVRRLNDTTAVNKESDSHIASANLPSRIHEAAMRTIDEKNKAVPKKVEVPMLLYCNSCMNMTVAH